MLDFKLVFQFIFYFFIIFLSGCGGGGGGSSSIITYPNEVFIYLEGNIPTSLNVVTNNINTLGLGYSLSTNKYSIVVTDQYLNKEVTKAIISNNKFLVKIPVNKLGNEYIMLVIKDEDNGRFLYRNFLGRVPRLDEIPANVKSIKINNIIISDFSTALALYSLEKNILPPTFINFKDYKGETDIVKDYESIRMLVQSQIINSVGGIINVTELANALKTLVFVLSSDKLSNEVKNEIIPLPRNFVLASDSLNYFVNSVKNSQAIVEIRNNNLREHVIINKNRIDKDTTYEQIKNIVNDIKPLQKVENPIISVKGGTYDRTVEVEITCNTKDAKIYYTLDGKVPNASSILYTKPIILTKSVKLSVIAVKDEMLDSDVLVENYVINILEKLEKPIFRPDFGQYSSTIEVSITSNISDAIIYYTLDGSIPNKNSNRYVGSILISNTTFIRAIAVKDGYIDSDVSSGTYEIVTLPRVIKPPVFSKKSGTYNETFEVTLTCEDNNCDIYYTLDNTTPNLNSIKYTKPIKIEKDVVVKAIAVRGSERSVVSEARYEIRFNLLKVANPRFNIDSGIYNETLEVRITTDTDGAKIYYTLDQREPYPNGELYNNGTIEVTTDVTIKAIAVKEGYINSDVVIRQYKVSIPGSFQIPKPTGLFYYSLNKLIKWNPVVVENKEIEYIVFIDGVEVSERVSKPEFSVAYFMDGWRTVCVRAKIKDSSHPLDYGPMSDILRFNIKSAMSLPAIESINFNNGYFNWQPLVSGNDVLAYRIMFDDNINDLYITKSACYGILPKFKTGRHTMRVQSILIEENNLEIKVLDEGAWSNVYEFEGETSNSYEMIPIPTNFTYNSNTNELKWTISKPVSHYIFNILACYDRVSLNRRVYQNLLQVIGTDSISLEQVKSKLPTDYSNCVLEVVTFDGFNYSLKSEPILLFKNELPTVPKVRGLKYDNDTKIVKWDSVYVDDMPCAYRVKIDNVIKSNILYQNEYLVSGLSVGTHEIQVQALLSNYNPPISGDFSDPLYFRVDALIPKVSGLTFVKSSMLVKWVPVVANEQMCFYKVKLDNVELEQVITKPEFDVSNLEKGIHKIQVKAILANVEPEVFGDYSDIFTFDTSDSGKDELPMITEFQFDSYNNIVRWQPIVVEKLPIASYVIELDNEIVTHEDGSIYTKRACYGISERVTLGNHVIRVKPIIYELNPKIEGRFSEPYSFFVQRQDALYKKITPPPSVAFDEYNQTLFWEKSVTTIGTPCYYLISYLNTGTKVSEQVFKVDDTKLNIGTLRLDPKFYSMPPGKYSIEVQGGVIENSKAKSLKTQVLILELTEKRVWKNIK